MLGEALILGTSSVCDLGGTAGGRENVSSFPVNQSLGGRDGRRGAWSSRTEDAIWEFIATELRCLRVREGLDVISMGAELSGLGSLGWCESCGAIGV